MKFQAPSMEEQEGETAVFVRSAPYQDSPSLPRSHVSPEERLSQVRCSSVLDTSPDFGRIRQGLEDRKQQWQQFLQASLPGDLPASPAKLAYQRGLAHMNLEIETQTKERQDYMTSIETLMAKRSAEARAQFLEFRAKQKELDELRRKKELEDYQRRQKQEKEKEEEEALRKQQAREREESQTYPSTSNVLEAKERITSVQSEQPPASSTLSTEPSVPKVESLHQHEGTSDPWAGTPPTTAQMVTPTINIYTSEEVSEKILHYATLLKQLETSLESFMESPETKTLRLNIRMRIQRRITQIAATKEQVMMVAKDLNDIFNELVSIPLAKQYALWILAQKMVEQGETQVHVHQKSAFPIAATLLLVCDRQPELLPIFLACLIQKCPYVAPAYIPRPASAAKESEYRLRLGFLQKTDGSFETEESYFERMAGIISLYAAFVQSPHPRHPYGISFAWQWLATLLNRPPRRITPVILVAFLQVAGYTLSNQYRRQFTKLLSFIKSDYLQRLPEGCVGSKARLELYIEEFEKQHRIPLPEGYLS